jgi:hypothetical protein
MYRGRQFFLAPDEIKDKMQPDTQQAQDKKQQKEATKERRSKRKK